MFRKIPRSKLEFILNNPDEYVDLYTIQNKSVMNEILSGVYTVDESNCMFNEDGECDVIKFAYMWIKHKGKFDNYPVWSTLKSQIGKRRKDFYYNLNTIEIKFKKKCKDILLSDYESWHCALNGWHTNDSECYNRSEIIKSWDYILDVLRKPDEVFGSPIIQVCCNDIKLEDIISIKEVNPKRYIWRKSV